ncbi:hypothetical protein CEXT_78861 [Caerostris extrusa]|uniref:Uncharacterized protein n=1 Tax=Caerostris extrusa TaxID=172846 RepID=A0AAV4N5H0_CAEEX|nr:hypothetical protein CEXT_78861 [Caerostris extrusa]
MTGKSLCGINSSIGLYFKRNDNTLASGMMFVKSLRQQVIPSHPAYIFYQLNEVDGILRPFRGALLLKFTWDKFYNKINATKYGLFLDCFEQLIIFSGNKIAKPYHQLDKCVEYSRPPRIELF